MARHRYRGQSREFPGIVIRIGFEWVRITHPPYGMKVVRT